jgi:hypothetical protein
VRTRSSRDGKVSEADESRLADIRRLRDTAEQAVLRGRYTEGLYACQRLEELEPKEPAWARRAAYCLARLGRHAEQVAALQRAARGYESAGFLRKAAAMYRLALAVSPGDQEMHQRSAELNAGRVTGLERLQGPASLQYYTPSEIPPPIEPRATNGAGDLVEDYEGIEFTDPEIDPD